MKLIGQPEALPLKPLGNLPVTPGRDFGKDVASDQLPETPNRAQVRATRGTPIDPYAGWLTPTRLVGVRVP